MKYIFLFALGVTIIAGIISLVLAPMISFKYTTYEGDVYQNGKFIPHEWLVCQQDSDCMAGACCHSSFCVNKLGRPDCVDAFCTKECRNGTLDCGYGSCACIDGKCAVELVQPNVTA